MKKVFDIQRKFRFTVYILLAVSLLLIGFSTFVFIRSLNLVERSRQKIYVLDGGKSLMLALSQDLAQNRPVEAREHVRRFHELFFTLSPDKNAIESNINRALFLVDKSAFRYYKDMEEKGYYNRVKQITTGC